MSVTVLAACSSFLLLMGASASPETAGATTTQALSGTAAAVEAEAQVDGQAEVEHHPVPSLEPSPPFADVRAVQPRTIRPAPLPPAPSPEAEPEPEDVPVIASSDDRRAWLAAGGDSRDPVDRGGRRVRWSLEVEAATGLAVNDVLRTAESALYDERSWAREFDLVRGAPSDASIRVLVATPETVDRLCAEAGLQTGGWLSCWNGNVAAINLERWNQGTREIRDLDLYRAYVVNHEVGHGLGRGHVECGGAGRLADVMQQQTKSLDGCRANPWAHPDA